MAQIIPVRCFTCGKTLSAINEKMKNGGGIPLKRCCIRMVITQVDTDFMLDYPIKREYEHTRKTPDGSYRIITARTEDPFNQFPQLTSHDVGPNRLPEIYTRSSTSASLPEISFPIRNIQRRNSEEEIEIKRKVEKSPKKSSQSEEKTSSTNSTPSKIHPFMARAAKINGLKTEIKKPASESSLNSMKKKK